MAHPFKFQGDDYYPPPAPVDVYYSNNRFLPASCSLPAVPTWHPQPQHPPYSNSMGNIDSIEPPGHLTRIPVSFSAAFLPSLIVRSN